MSHLFAPGYWHAYVQRIADWALSALPAILFILGLAFFALRLQAYVLGRAKVLLVARAAALPDVDERETEKRLQTLLGILGIAIRTVVWIIVAMLILRRLGLDIAPLIAGAGIVGLAVGFGAQELVRDVISGFFVLLENQVRVGDVAVINGTSGLVEGIGLRTIKLRDLSGIVHVFQNGKIDSLANRTKDWSAMVFDVGVAYKEDTDVVTEVMREVAGGMQADADLSPKILEPLEVLGVDAFDDSAVVIRARLKTRPGEQWALGREFRRRLKQAFDARRIEIPFPHRTLYWGEASQPFRLSQEGGASGIAASS